MKMQMRQIQICSICGNNVTDHQSTCVIQELNDCLDKLRNLRCPKCSRTVEINSFDFFECTKCHTQFTNCKWIDDAKTFYLIGGQKEVFVLEMPDKGKGNFPLLNKIKILRRRIRDIEIA